MAANPGIPAATVSLLSGVAGTIGSVLDARGKYLAFKEQARRNLINKRKQSQEEQRTAGERAELRMAQFQSDVGAVASMSGGGSSLVDSSIYRQSIAYGAALEETSDRNATQIRLGQIEEEMKATREAVIQARKQTAVNTIFSVLGGIKEGAPNLATLQGAVVAKREANKVKTPSFKVAQPSMIQRDQPSAFHGYSPDSITLMDQLSENY